MRRIRSYFGQTSTELMLVISVVTIAVTGASYVFVPRFQQGVEALGANVKTILSTGSFAGLGLANVGSGDVAVGDTGAAGGEGEASSPRDAGGWLGNLFGDLDAWFEQLRLAMQDDGEPPPTGISGLVCGQWGLSYVANQLGLSDVEMQRFMNASQALGFARDGDYRLTAREVAALARLSGMSARVNHHRNFNQARDWLVQQMESGRYPMVLIRGPDGTPHWIVPTGVVKDATGRIIEYKYRDANSGEEQTMEAADFDRDWGAQGYEGVSLGKGSGVNLLTLVD